MKLNSICIQNFRSFDNLTIEFDERLTVLVGVNGSGKSAVLDALEPGIALITATFLQSSYQDILSYLGCRSGYFFSHLDLPLTTDNNTITINYNVDNVEFSYEEIYDNSFNLPKTHDLKTYINIISPHFSHYEINKPILVKYSSNRLINKSEAKLSINSKYKQGPDESYKGIIDPCIDYSSILSWFDDINNKEARFVRDNRDLSFRLPEMEVLRQAISKTLLEEYINPNFDLATYEMTLVKKDTNINFPVSSLSQGFQSILSLTLDLARRMIMANRVMDSSAVLNTPAIVLIDEIDLHLHPSWRQKVLPILLDVFPGAQFIVTTHSPLVLTSIKPENIVILDGKSAIPATSSTYGATISTVLRDIFAVNERPDNEVFRQLSRYFELINEGLFNSEEGIKIRKFLNKYIADDPSLVKADLLIKSYEISENIKNAQNQSST
ncbi:MAG: AAA family ATPase [Deltaproteobacteria bacterium]|jgi:predicted ATP-binding protein involved in virulence|nr:AAA family ATPase [Deltaproteobacteria bacterium]